MCSTASAWRGPPALGGWEQLAAHRRPQLLPAGAGTADGDRPQPHSGTHCAPQAGEEHPEPPQHRAGATGPWGGGWWWQVRVAALPACHATAAGLGPGTEHPSSAKAIHPLCTTICH